MKLVAWTDGKGNYFDKNSFFPVDDLIPLYTHPVKELDEDFDAICLENKRLQAEIDSLKDKLMLAKQSLEIVEGWIKK